MSTQTVVNSQNNELSNPCNESSFKYEVLDYIPVVSTVSGIARISYGFLQELYSVAQTVSELVDMLFHPFAESYEDRSTHTYNQGQSNMARGMFAMLPIIGNVGLYLYDHSRFAKSGDKINWLVLFP